jgi:hypothetical protein
MEIVQPRSRSGKPVVRVGSFSFTMADAARATNQCGGCLVPLVIQSSFGYAAGDDFEDRRMSLCACPGAAGHGSLNDVCHRPSKARLVEFAASRFAAPAGG